MIRRARPIVACSICSMPSSRMPPRLSPRPAAWFTTTAIAAYGRSSSRASAASGMPVMPTISAPSRSSRSISAADSSRGPWVAAYTAPSTTVSPHARAAARSFCRRRSAYGAVKSMCVTGTSPPSKNVERRPQV